MIFKFEDGQGVSWILTNNILFCFKLQYDWPIECSKFYNTRLRMPLQHCLCISCHHFCHANQTHPKVYDCKLPWISGSIPDTFLLLELDISINWFPVFLITDFNTYFWIQILFSNQLENLYQIITVLTSMLNLLWEEVCYRQYVSIQNNWNKQKILYSNKGYKPMFLCHLLCIQ